MSWSYENTVKPVCVGHHRDQKMESKTFTNSKNHFFITIYFINHIFYLPLTSFHGSLFLSYRNAVFISWIVIKRMQGFRMSSKGLHNLCWLIRFQNRYWICIPYMLENLIVSICWFLQSSLKFCLFSQLRSNESSDRMFVTSKKGGKIEELAIAKTIFVP